MKKGFTMAEVLITIGIIGIVVAMTLPAVISGFERKRNAVVLRRAYRDLANFALMYAAENGCISKLSECSMPASDFSTSFARFLVEKQNFKDLHHCKYAQNSQITFWLNSQREWSRTPYYGCASMESSIHHYYLQAPSGLYGYFIYPFPYDMYYFTRNRKDYFRLAVIIFTDSSKMGYSIRYGTSDDGSTKKYPQEGRNMFRVFVMDSKRILPNGSSECDQSSNSYYCNPMSDANCGYEAGDFSACMMQVINDGWEIKYRY